ncbi:MAG TPA: glucosaminidase domain-containing protein [Chloroflexota bacterium]
MQLVLGAGGLTLLAAAGLSRAESLSRVIASRPPVVAARPTAEQTRFIERVGRVAQQFHPSVGLPPSLVTAMAINETGWGSSDLCSRANNYFGIKAEVGDGTLGSMLYDTREVVDGRVVVVQAHFRVYRSLEESVDDLGLFLHGNPRYGSIWTRTADPRATALALSRAGYATDPEWAPKLIALIDAFGLDALDGPAWLPDWLWRSSLV